MPNDLIFLQKLISAFCIVMVIATAAAIYSFSRLSVVKENSAWTSDTYRVFKSTAEMLSGLIDQETGLRGYLIDGQDQVPGSEPVGQLQNV